MNSGAAVEMIGRWTPMVWGEASRPGPPAIEAHREHADPEVFVTASGPTAFRCGACFAIEREEAVANERAAVQVMLGDVRRQVGDSPPLGPVALTYSPRAAAALAASAT